MHHTYAVHATVPRDIRKEFSHADLGMALVSIGHSLIHADSDVGIPTDETVIMGARDIRIFAEAVAVPSPKDGSAQHEWRVELEMGSRVEVKPIELD